MMKPKMTMFLLVMSNIATILSIRNWPFLAEYGLSSAVFILISILTFFAPVAFVSAELASAWPENGVFGWIKEAFNETWGFLSVWLLWIENVIWYPTVFTFIVATLSYALNPQLAQHAVYNVILSLGLFWTILLFSFRGFRFSGWINSFAVLFGTLLPGTCILFFGGFGLASGSLVLDLSWKAFIPNLQDWQQLAFLASLSLTFAGMELNAVFANDLQNPRKNFPLVIFISGLLISFFYILGTLAVSIMIPKSQLNLVTAIVESIHSYLKMFGIEPLLPLFSLMIALGSLGGVSAWLTGTSQTLLIVGRNGHLPERLCKTNRKGMPVPILLLQGAIVSIVCLIFILMPDLSSAFWTLTVLASQLYLLMYMLMFVAAIVLRFKQPFVQRICKIPGGPHAGMIFVAGLGLLGCIVSFLIGFIPPKHFASQTLILHETCLIGGCIFFVALPFLLKKLSTKSETKYMIKSVSR